MVMFCPQCEGEFVEGVETCPDCELALVAEDPRPRPPLPDARLLDAGGESVVVLRTGRLFEADLAASTLEEAGVPYYRQEQSSSGAVFEMPAAPTPGPGTWWVVRVPTAVAEEARFVLEQLPLGLDDSPGVWDFGPTPEAKSFFKSWAFATLLFLAAGLLGGLLSLLRKLFGW